ncbi:MAG: hypothetical protein WC054_05470 [Candidatus Nanopelagicales bacterium]|jgi:hypothetical protein
MNLAAFVLTMQSMREPIPQPVSPAVRTEIIEAATIVNYGDAVVSADDLAPATCDSGTGFYMVVSVYRARQLQELNPGLVCTPGERYGATGA